MPLTLLLLLFSPEAALLDAVQKHKVFESALQLLVGLHGSVYVRRPDHLQMLLSGTVAARLQHLRQQVLHEPGQHADGPVIAFADGPTVTSRLPGAAIASWFLLAAAGEDGAELHLLSPEQGAVSATPSLDAGRWLGEVAWTPSPATLVASGSDAAVLIDEISTRQATYAAAELCGLSSAMLAMTASYAGDREQFAKPIGSFQAVKHLLADVRIALEFAQQDAAVAKALASDLGTLAARTCLQVHGGIGYTWEHDLSLWMKRAWSLAADYGTAPVQRARALHLSLFD